MISDRFLQHPFHNEEPRVQLKVTDIQNSTIVSKRNIISGVFMRPRSTCISCETNREMGISIMHGRVS